MLRKYLISWRLPLTSYVGSKFIAQPVYRVDRSYSWNYSHSPTLPRVRRVPSGPGGKLLDHHLNSPIGVAAGPLLNSKWIEAYSRVGFDVLTYKTVRSMAMPAHGLPNIRAVENRMDAEQLVQDYARCAAWAAEAGADAIEVHLAVPDPFAEQPQLIYENIPLSAQILYRVRTTMPKPVLAKLGVFRTPRLLHETATKLASWASGFVMTHGVRRRVVDEDGNAAFEGAGRDRATIVGADTWPLASRQIEEMLSWRKAGAWDRAILGVGGITTVERADHLLREGADVALIATTALFDPLFAIH